MADAFQLLQAANQHTANMFAIIDRNQQEQANLALQISNNQANLAFKGFELGEQMRMDDARVAEARAINSIRAGQLELEKRKIDQAEKLFPLQLQTEQFKLENEKQRMLIQQQAAQKAIFDDTIQPIQSEFSAAFATAQDPEMAREYLNLKESARKNNIDLDQFSSATRGIISKYQDSPFKSSEYNPEVSQYLQVFAPSEAKRYETRNPVNQKNRALLAGSMLTASDAGFAQFAQENGHLFTPEETQVIATGRTIVGQIEAENEKLLQQASNLDVLAMKSKELDPEKKSLYDAQREAVAQRIEENRKKMIGISSNISSGNFSLDLGEDKSSASAPPPTTQEIEERVASVSQASNLGLPNKALETSRDENRATRINQFVKTLKDSTGRSESKDFPSELLGLDFSYTLGTRKNDIPNFETLAAIKDTIEGNLRNTYSNSNSREFHKRYGENAINEILKHAKNVHGVPVSDFAAERIKGYKAVSIGDGDTKIIPIGRDGYLNSYEKLQSVLDNIDDADERKEVERELTSAIITLGIGSSVQD